MSRAKSEFTIILGQVTHAVRSLECPECYGRGWDAVSDNPQEADYEEWICKTCNGTGIAPDAQLPGLRRATLE